MAFRLIVFICWINFAFLYPTQCPLWSILLSFILLNVHCDESEKLNILLCRSQAPSETPSLDWRRLTVMLEWLQGKKKIGDVHLIIPVMFSLLSLWVPHASRIPNSFKLT